MNIQQYLQDRKKMVEEALFKHLPPPNTYPAVIHEAMHYSLAAGGKRLRPILVLASAEAIGHCDPAAMAPLYCAVEYIHTYSLIHDDLPAMDDDDFRRGKPSCHKAFGEGIAILAGDALLTYAFELLTHLAPPEGVFPEELVVRIIKDISCSIGTTGLIGGQVVDLQSEAVRVDLDTITYIHRHKTGALFKTCILSGARLAGATEKELEHLANYADAFGMAFQIIDDILDIEGDPALLGKPTGSDAKKQKATYPGLMGIEAARAKAEDCISQAVRALESFGEQAEALRQLAVYIGQREI
ncbi:MAG TPA: polyprenyl synthetase family protein [Clostridia bacterium]|nr:polyprenyl synthetase family protein [Clostridia bacterium]